MTERAKHTPGPWAVTGTYGEGHDRVVSVGIDDRKAGRSLGELAHAVAGHCTQDAYDTQDANARLIAAAPALLKACKEIHKLWNCPTPKRMKDWSARCDVMADYARAAIALAEGGAA